MASPKPGLSPGKYTRVIRSVLASVNAKRHPRYHYTEEQLRHSRARRFVYLRRAIWTALRDHWGYSYPSIGAVAGKDHTTIMFGIRQYAKLPDDIRQKMDRHINTDLLLGQNSTIRMLDTCIEQTADAPLDGPDHIPEELDMSSQRAA